MACLTWISDDNLIKAVNQLLDIASDALKQAEIKFNKNVIDPFSAIFQIAGFETPFAQWVLSEQARQSQKSLQNHIGDFHQNILGSVDGWQNLKTGNIMDLLSTENKILAELKNKHNTVKGANLSDLYRSMESEVMSKFSRYMDYTIYYVTIIPKNPVRFDKPFTPSDKQIGQRLPKNEKVRIIDGASFYSMVTGINNALEQLFDSLPRIISDNSDIKFSESDVQNLKTYFISAYG